MKKIRAIIIMTNDKDKLVIDEIYPSFHHVYEHMKELQKSGYKFVHLIACTIDD